jgi:hypothetical protein
MRKVRPLFEIDGKRVHPLVHLAREYTLMELAKALGHKNHSTVAIYVMRARKSPSTRIPAEWVIPLAKLMKVKPAMLRPDIYLPHWAIPRDWDAEAKAA